MDESMVVIGMDPHKRSATIEVMSVDEQILGRGRFETDVAGYRAMVRFAKRWPSRTWAVEGCQGIGGHIARRLVMAGETVVDVPPKLSARVRVFATGQGRKTDATDAHSIALVGVRMAGLRPVATNDQLAILRLLVDRRRSIGEDHTRMTSQLHQLLLDLIPGGAKRDLSAAQARALIAGIRPRDQVGKTRRRIAAELIADLERIYQRKKAANKELLALLKATGTSLMQLNGIGPSSAARLLVEVGDISRFPDRNHFASWNGTAPIDASSGEHTRHRLSRGGNRQINRAIHVMAVVQLRNATEGRTYFDRRKAAGKTSMEAMRSLKRRLSDIVYRTMFADAIALGQAREGNGATTLTPARPARHPTPALRKSHNPDPPQQAYDQPKSPPLDTEGSQERKLSSLHLGQQVALSVGSSSLMTLKRFGLEPHGATTTDIAPALRTVAAFADLAFTLAVKCPALSVRLREPAYNPRRIHIPFSVWSRPSPAHCVGAPLKQTCEPPDGHAPTAACARSWSSQ